MVAGDCGAALERQVGLADTTGVGASRSPDDALVLAFADLSAALERLMAAAAEQIGPVVDLDADHYWSLDVRDAFDLSRDPSVEAGQLSEDVATVRELLSRAEGEVFLWHDLEHVIGILQRVAALARP
jgi:hypothetical protein